MESWGGPRHPSGTLPPPTSLTRAWPSRWVSVSLLVGPAGALHLYQMPVHLSMVGWHPTPPLCTAIPAATRHTKGFCWVETNGFTNACMWRIYRKDSSYHLNTVNCKAAGMKKSHDNTLNFCRCSYVTEKLTALTALTKRIAVRNFTAATLTLSDQ